jgi:hypothetical protein
MNVGLYDVDSRIPNLALMRISAWHKAQGDSTELYMPLLHEKYHRVYASSIFDFSDKSYIQDDMILGGTGVDLTTNLAPEIEQMNPDYDLYGYGHNIGFAMRGCRFKCSFCVVPRKEGNAHSKSTIRQLLTNKTNSNFLMLLDNDFFGNPNWSDCIEEIKDLKLRVNFSQGLNIRIISEKQASALASVDFRDNSNNMPRIYFAWDQIKDERTILRGFHRCIDAGIKPYQMQFFVLIGYDSTPEQDLHRVMTIKSLGADPYVMPYKKKDPYQMRFTRWVNRRAIFNSCSWESYQFC